MVDRVFNINHHCWNGRGGSRGLVTHVWDRTFKSIKDEIESKGLGRYRITFEYIGESVEGHQGAADATC